MIEKIDINNLRNNQTHYDNHQTLINRIILKINKKRNLFLMNNHFLPNIVVNNDLLLYISDSSMFVYSSVVDKEIDNSMKLYGYIRNMKLYVDYSGILKEGEFSFFNDINIWKRDIQKIFRKEKFKKILNDIRIDK